MIAGEPAGSPAILNGQSRKTPRAKQNIPAEKQREQEEAMLQTDSTEVRHQQHNIPIIDEQHDELPRHPYQALKELPRDATPAQQDSVLQAVYSNSAAKQPGTPLDTASVLNREKAVSALEKVELPQYYKQNFFSADSMWHPELNGGRYGVAGDPVPYTISGDSTITALLLSCFILALVAFSKSKNFILRQAKQFFRVQRSGTTEMTETTNEFRFQFFLTAQTCLLLSLVTFFFAQECNSDTFLVSSQYQLIAMFFGVFVGYLLLKTLLYTIVNWIFFSGRQNSQWMKSFLFTSSVEGVVMFPVVVSQAYFGLSLKNTIIYVATVIILSRLLSLYKCFLIFFRQKGVYLQIILYFCALEIMPLLALCGVLSILINYLNVNF